LRSAANELEQVYSARLSRLEADVADLSKVPEEQSSLRTALAGLEGQLASLSESLTQSQSRIRELESASQAQEARHQEALARLGGLAGRQEETQRSIEDQAQALERLGERIGQAEQSFAAQQDALRERVESLAAAVRAGGDESSRLSALCAQFQEAQQAIRQRLDAQAEVIRALHNAALEQTTRREELRAAVQRLEEIAGALNPVKPLPEQL
jgi:chromosome segregation ATPase